MIFLTLLISRMAPWTFAHYPQICPHLPQKCRLIVVNAKERDTSVLYKSKVFKPAYNVQVYDVGLLLHGEHYYALTLINAQLITHVRIVLKLKYSAVSGVKMSPKDVCMWAFDDKINMEAVFIAHNDSSYDSHFILSYLVENTEYPELLSNGDNILQMYIKACESKFIDSCCFLSMPLSKFSDTFNFSDVVKGTFPYCFNTPNNYGYVGLLPSLHYYEPDGLKEPARSKHIQWHGEHSNDEFIFDSEIHDYCTAGVALIKVGCMMFRVSFLSDTGIDLFRSCTIACACMHVFPTSHLKEKTIAWVPPNGYRSMRN